MRERKPEDMLVLPRLHWAARDVLEQPATYAGQMGRESMLYYVECGQMLVDMAEQSFNFEAGTLLILPMGVPYSYQLKASTSVLLVFFAQCQFEFEDTPRTLRLPPDDMAVRWMQDLALLQTQHNMQREITGHLLATLLARLKQIEGREAALKSLHPAVAAVIGWMDEHLDEPVTLQSLAAHAHCSPSHLRALFKQQVGSGVLRYQQDRRMQRALELLNQSHLSLREIARRCGYHDAEYFSRLFRRYHHVSPSYLRQRQ